MRTLTTNMGKQFQALKNFNFVKLDCWYHTKMLIRNKLKNNKYEENVLRYVDLIQHMPSKEVFEHVLMLFENKYQEFEDPEEFLDYFERFGMIDHPNWFEGVYIFASSTNNA